MERGFNIHILDDDKLKQFEDKYDVKIVDNQIMFVSKKRKGMIAFDIGSKFTVNLNKNNIILTRLTISPLSVDLWQKIDGVSLFRVQNAVNKLTVMRQDVTLDNVKKVL